MADGQKIGGKTTIPVGEMAKANLDKIFPHLTQEQITALREGKPVPPSPNWDGLGDTISKIDKMAAGQPSRDPVDVLHISELTDKFTQLQDATRDMRHRDGVFNGVVTAMGRRLPTVTAILVFQDRNRLRRARKAVNQFVAQSYPNKQIVIVNASDLAITNVAHKAVLELKWDGLDAVTTGDLRNYGIDNAAGDLIFPFWDDDDVYDRDLLTYLVANHTPGRGVMLTSQLRVDIKNSAAYVHVETDGIPNTLLCPKTEARFEHRTAGDDFAFVQRHWALKSEVVDTSAYPLNTLLMRVFDANNVLSAEEFMVGHHTADYVGMWELGASEADHMKAVLATFGLKAEPKLSTELTQPTGV